VFLLGNKGLWSTGVAETKNQPWTFTNSLPYCSFRALQIIYKSLQYQQMHSSTIMYFTYN